MTIAELKSIQAARDLKDVHLVWFGENGFTIAHTDRERAIATEDGPPLDECELYQALSALDGPLEVPGVYVATPHQADPVSESYRSGSVGWDFEPVPDA